MLADLAGERRDVGARDVGGVRDDEIERAVERCTVVRDQE
jgi:hypothetical protein